MAEPRDTNVLPFEASAPDKPLRQEAAHSITGRSGTVAEIGRELGDLDFEPDDLLASLRPMDKARTVPPPPVIDESPTGKLLEAIRPEVGQPELRNAIPLLPPEPVTGLEAQLQPNLLPPDATEEEAAPSSNSWDLGPLETTQTNKPAIPRFESVPASASPRSISPPSLGHALGRESLRPSAPEIATIEVPEVVCGDEITALEELITLPPERLTHLDFPLERPAPSHLDQLGLASTFTELAQLLDAEANASRPPQERAELALVASELYAMTGERTVAEATLTRAPKTGIPICATQLRQLAFEPDDLTAYGKHLRGELRASVPHETRRHLMALYADVARRIGSDEAEQRRHLELSLRAFPTDPRFQLQRLASQLGDGAPSSGRVRQSPGSDTLGHPDTARELFQLRTNTTTLSESNHPLLACLALRRGFDDAALPQIVSSLEQLTRKPGIEDAAQWLLATIASCSKDHHRLAMGLLEKLAESGDADAELAWLECQLRTAQSKPSSLEVFSLGIASKLRTEEQLALSVAIGADGETVRLLCDKLAAELPLRDEFAPLLNGVVSRVLEQPARVGLERRCDAQIQLGDALASVRGNKRSSDASVGLSPLPQSLLYAVEQLEAIDTSAPQIAALRLWNAIGNNSLPAIAEALLSLRPHLSPSQAVSFCALAAFLTELSGQRGEAEAQLRESLEGNEPLEVAIRGLAAWSKDTLVSPLLDQLVATLPPSLRRTILEIDSYYRKLGALAAAGLTSADPHAQQVLLEQLGSVPREFRPFVATLVGNQIPWSELLLDPDSPEERRFLEFLVSVSKPLKGVAPLSSRPSSGDALAQLPETFEEGPLPLPIFATLDRAKGCLRTRITASTLDDWEAIHQVLLSPSAVQISDALSETQGGDLERFEARLNQARQSETDGEFLSHLLRATAVDPEREPAVGSLRTVQLCLERFPSHLGALRSLLLARSTQGQNDEVAEIAGRIALVWDKPDRYAHAWLHCVANRSRQSQHDGQAPTTLSLTEVIEHDPAPETWAIRRLLGQALRHKDDPHVIEYCLKLRERTTNPIDIATLTLRAAEASLRMEQWDDAESLLDQTLQYVPDHVVALSMRAEILEARGKQQQAAEAYESLGNASGMPAHKVAAWLHAAELFSGVTPQDGSYEQAIRCLEQVLQLDQTQAAAAEQLHSLYAETGRHEELVTLLTQQLLQANSPDLRATLEVERAELLMQLERVDEAQAGLERALTQVPDHEPSLSLLARVLEQQGQYEETEQLLLTLAASQNNEELSLDAYRRLASLYETVLEQPTRAEVAYREILRRNPGDPAGDRLVSVLLRLDNPVAAIAILCQLIEHGKDTPLERDRTLELARIYDTSLKERRRAEEVLEKARRRYPNDVAVLSALAEFYQRGKDHAAFSALLDRSVTDARRALASGRFEIGFFETIALVGRLREAPDVSLVAQSTLGAIAMSPRPITGLGLRAVSDDFADLLAPDVLSLPLRALLRRTGWALSAGSPVDLRSLRATPLSEHAPELSQHLRDLAAAFGLNEFETYLSPALGTACQPIGATPQTLGSRTATLVVGLGYVALADIRVQDALALRALRVLSANATALANTSPVDLWPLVAAYLSAHLPHFEPTMVDAKRVEQLRRPIQQALPATLDRDLPMLAADVVATIGNRASQLGGAVQQWGSRTALLAVGDPNAVLSGIALATGQHERFFASPEERSKWILRNTEARDVAVFSVSEAYLDARARNLPQP